MKTQACYSRNGILILGVLCVMLMATLAFGQQQPPPQPNQPAQGGYSTPGMPRPGMMRGTGSPGMMQGMPRMGRESMMRRSRGNRRRDSIGEQFNPQVQKELGITAEQRQKLEDIRFDMEKEAIQHRSALQIHRLELSRLINAENPDRAAIDKKIQEVSQEEGSLMRSSIDGRLNARGVLTAEQRTKLAQLRQNRWRVGRRQAEGGMRPGQPASKAGQRAPLPVAPTKPTQ